MATYFVRYKGWKRTVEALRHNKAEAQEKVEYLRRHGIECVWGYYDENKERIKL